MGDLFRGDRGQRNHIAEFFLTEVNRLTEAHGSEAIQVVVAAAWALQAKCLFLLVLYRQKVFLRV